MATATTKKQHFFLINALGQSVHRHGPFGSAEAAQEFAEKHYPNFAAWIVPAVPANDRARKSSLNKDGNSVAEG